MTFVRAVNKFLSLFKEKIKDEAINNLVVNSLRSFVGNLHVPVVSPLKIKFISLQSFSIKKLPTCIHDDDICVQIVHFLISTDGVLYSHKIDILTVNEAKLVSSISSNDIHLSVYDVVRRDRYRNGRHGGGVCIFAKNNLNFPIREDLMIMITLNLFLLKFMVIGSRQRFATFDNHVLHVTVDNEPVRKVNSRKTLG